MTGNATLQLDRSGDAPGAARQFVHDVASESGLDSLEPTLEALTDELVSSAVAHSDGPVRLKVYVRDREVVIEVMDQGPLAAGIDPGTPDVAAALTLVAELSGSWGVEPHEHGKTVWCSVPR